MARLLASRTTSASAKRSGESGRDRPSRGTRRVCRDRSPPAAISAGRRSPSASNRTRCPSRPPARRATEGRDARRGRRAVAPAGIRDLIDEIERRRPQRDQDVEGEAERIGLQRLGRLRQPEPGRRSLRPTSVNSERRRSARHRMGDAVDLHFRRPTRRPPGTGWGPGTTNAPDRRATGVRVPRSARPSARRRDARSRRSHRRWRGGWSGMRAAA